MAAIRCLALLLIPTKTKQTDGDVAYVIRFVPVRKKCSYVPLITL